jgi:hypothetical protein
MQSPISMPRTRGLAVPALLAATAMLGLDACLSASENDVPVALEKGYVFALTSDPATGSYSVYGLDSAYTMNSIEAVHSDAAVRYLGGDDIFIINRLGRDNLQIVDRHNLKTVLQIPLPPLSNPYDVAVKDSLIYVAYYARAEIGIYRQSDGAAAGKIDISAYADTSDHLPEACALAFVNGDLFALIQNLDATYKSDNARILKIDVGSKTVKKSLVLPFGNPMGMAWDSAGARLYVSCLGQYVNGNSSINTDGGIVAVNPSTLELTDTVALEKDLGGNVNEPIYHDGGLILTVGAGTQDKVIFLSVADGKATEIVKLGGYATGGLALDAATSTLCVGDRNAESPRLRLFELGTWKEKSSPGIDLGVQPIMNLAVVR